MTQITSTMDILAQFIFLIGVIALGFGLVLRGVAKGQSDPIIRAGAYATAGAVVIFVVLGSR